MFAWAQVSISGFYEWRGRPASATVERRADLAVAVKKVFDDSDQTYGYRRVHAQLGREGVAGGPELVRAVMRDLGLVACQPRPFRVTTLADDDAGTTPDLVERDFAAAGDDELRGVLDTYGREQAWAPVHVADLYRETELTRERYERKAALTAAEANAPKLFCVAGNPGAEADFLAAATVQRVGVIFVIV
ncbi:MAG: IS3 family transposase, partial [Actinophytocola sp.]|nr:IS3 family transposase [Actinophytocola sp.]